MDILAEFETYLPNWCHEHHLPVPKEKFTEHWKMAWEDFVKEVLNENHAQIMDSYQNMSIVQPKQRNDIIMTPVTPQPKEEIEQEVQPEQKKQPANDWEIVQQLMNENRQ